MHILKPELFFYLYYKLKDYEKFDWNFIDRVYC